MAAVQELVERAWRDAFGYEEPQTDAERVLWDHVLALAHASSSRSSGETDRASDTAAHCLTQLQREIRAKRTYCSASWGYFEAANIVARVDESIIALQEQKKRAFVDPLSWDLAPHPAVLATVEAVLLLFGVPVASDALTTWRTAWALWIVKNIDAHTGGWEWVATNEPAGLFTKPYALAPTHLERVQELLDETYRTPETHRCWHRMQAYARLRDWAAACAQYVHMTHHCLASFPAHAEIQRLVTPPRRTPQANVWFQLESADGVAYFYNRLLQTVTLTQPPDFDGAHVTSIPGVIRELIDDALARDVPTRLELEKRSRQRARAQLLAEDEWIECLDVHTQRPFYYSLKHYRVMWTAPESGAFIPCAESPAYAAVLRLQAAYRRRRLELKLQVKRTKRASLPVFAMFSKDVRTGKFYQ